MTPIRRVSREQVLQAFQELGFTEDCTNLYVTVLRQTSFPFQRLTIPNINAISTELIGLYLKDAGIDPRRFYQIIQQSR